MSPDTIIVVPCFNEANRLDCAAFASFLREHRDIALLFVNDGSTDATLQALEAMRRDADMGRVEICDLPRNVGKAEAVRQGVNRAFAQQPTFVGYWDADLATPLTDIVTFRRVLKEHDHLQLVMGSRIGLLGRRIERTRMRHYCGRVFATAASMALGLRVYDTQCGAKLFRAAPPIRQIFQEPFCSRWVFDVELLARLNDHGRPAEVVYEHPLNEWRDVAGSKLRWRHILRAVFDLAGIWRRYRLFRRSIVAPAALPISQKPERRKAA